MKSVGCTHHRRCSASSISCPSCHHRPPLLTLLRSHHPRRPAVCHRSCAHARLALGLWLQAHRSSFRRYSMLLVTTVPRTAALLQHGSAARLDAVQGSIGCRSSGGPEWKDCLGLEDRAYLQSCVSNGSPCMHTSSLTCSNHSRTRHLRLCFPLRLWPQA